MGSPPVCAGASAAVVTAVNSVRVYMIRLLPRRVVPPGLVTLPSLIRRPARPRHSSAAVVAVTAGLSAPGLPVTQNGRAAGLATPLSAVDHGSRAADSAEAGSTATLGVTFHLHTCSGPTHRGR